MGRPRSDGEDFSGIDPHKLWDLINSIKNRTSRDGHDSAQPLVDNWMRQATRMGMDTTRLSAINKHLAWSQGQLPMLRRRHSLAVDGAKEGADVGGGTGLVSAGSGSLGKYKTQAAAEKAAKDDAKSYEDGTISLQDYFKKLKANEFDPDYCRAAADALGDTKLHVLQQESFRYDPEHPQAGMTILATFVATAMRNGTTLKDDHGDEDIQLLAGLVPHARFPKDVLVNLGRQCMAPGGHMYGQYVWPALAADPAAATQFLHDNIASVPDWMKDDSDHHGDLPDDQAKDFAQVIKAGTIGGPGADQNMAADNTTKLITYYSNHSGNHTHSEIQAVFDQDIAYYFPDLQASLTDPAFANLGPGHVSVKPDAWRAFTGEAMLNPAAGGRLYAFAIQQADALSSNNPENPVAVHGAGLLEGFFSQEAHNIYQTMASDYKNGKGAWQNSFKDNAKLGASMTIDFALDPQGTLKDRAVDGVKKIIDLGIDAWPSDKAPAPSDPKQIGWGDEWQKSASQYFREHGEFKPVSTPDGMTWTGDPKQYAQEYDCPDFLSNQGFLKLSGTAQQQAKEKAAYNAWLKDPAVGQAIAGNDYFTQRDLGRHDGEDMAGD